MRLSQAGSLVDCSTGLMGRFVNRPDAPVIQLTMTAPLFSSFKLRSVEFANRIGVSPMCQYSSQDGFANDWHLVHLGSRAQGGAGLVTLEAAAVLPEGRISPDDLGIWKDEHIPALERIAKFLHEQGSRAGMQLAHAGRKGSTKSPFFGDGAVAGQRGRLDSRWLQAPLPSTITTRCLPRSIRRESTR